MLPDPVAAGEPEEERAIQPAFDTEVHILDTGRVPKARELQQSRQAPIVARELLAFQQERKAVVEREARDVGDAALLLQRGGHAGEAERVQEINRLLH